MGNRRLRIISIQINNPSMTHRLGLKKGSGSKFVKKCLPTPHTDHMNQKGMESDKLRTMLPIHPNTGIRFTVFLLYPTTGDYFILI